MALSALSREAKASQREFSVIVERQQELEKQLVQVSARAPRVMSYSVVVCVIVCLSVSSFAEQH